MSRERSSWAGVVRESYMAGVDRNVSHAWRMQDD